MFISLLQAHVEGKSFLLTTIYLWAIIKRIKCKAAAPTGIAISLVAPGLLQSTLMALALSFFSLSSKAAANIEVEGTNIGASTIHALFEFDGDFKTKLDFTKLDNKKVLEILEMKILLLDEVSMLDTDGWQSILEILTIAQQTRRPNGQPRDNIGELHLLLFGDFKQDAVFFIA